MDEKMIIQNYPELDKIKNCHLDSLMWKNLIKRLQAYEHRAMTKGTRYISRKASPSSTTIQKSDFSYADLDALKKATESSMTTFQKT